MLKDFPNSPLGLFYALHEYSAVRNIQHFPRQGQALRAIVDQDKVWEIPTNLFSFFYGLPDSREALRALIDKR